MRKFIIRVFQFLGISLGVYVMAYIACNYRNYYAFTHVLDCEVLSTCNSHEQCGIDPEIFKQYGNLNSIASQPWVWEAKLRLLLSTGRCHPKYLIIDRGCHEILWGYTDDDVAQLVARFLPLQLLSGTCPYDINWDKVLHYALGSRSFTTKWAAKPIGYRPIGTQLDIEGRVSEHFKNSIPPSNDDLSRFMGSLQSLVELARSNGIEPILLSTPKHTQYLAAEPCNVRELNKYITNFLVHSYNLRYLDYSNMVLGDDCFADADHLNPKGRAIFTRRLMEDLGFEE